MSYLITKEEILNAQRRARELKETYGISVSWQLLLYVPHDREAEAVAGVSADFLELTKVNRFVARPVGFKVYDSGVVFRYQNRVKAFMHLPPGGEDRVKAFRNAVKSVHVVELKNGRWVARPVESASDVDSARKCIEERGWAWCLALTVGYTESGVKAYWWRFIPLVVGAHFIELSPPGTGKTTFFVTLSRALNVVYMNELPSFAALIADARDGSLGAAATADILIIDEIDKIEIIENGWAYNALLSGMEQGIWVRSRGKMIQYENPLSVAFIGNCGQTKRVHVPCGMRQTRGVWEQLLGKMLKVNAGPFIDRVAVITTNAPRIKPEYLSNSLLKPSVSRGLHKLVNQNVEHIELTNDQRRDKQLSAIWHIYRLIHNAELAKSDLAALWEEGP